MGVNQVIYNGDTLVDLTGDTITSDALLKGTTAHDAAGNQITGTAVGGTLDHTQLINRDVADQHPMEAITGLSATLSGKAEKYAVEEQSASFTAADNTLYTVAGGSAAITITVPAAGQVYGTHIVFTAGSGTLTFEPSASMSYIGDDMTDWLAGDVWEFSCFNGRIIGKRWRNA